MEIEEHERFPKARRKSIFRLLAIDRSTRVGDELTGVVVDRNDDAPPKEPVSAIEANTKGPGRLGRSGRARPDTDGWCSRIEA